MSFYASALKVAGGDISFVKSALMLSAKPKPVRQGSRAGYRVPAVLLDNPQTASAIRHGDFPLLLFSQELLALLEAGLNLAEAIQTLHVKESSAVVRAFLGEILQALQEGKNFSDTLSDFPRCSGHLRGQLYAPPKHR